MSDVFKIGIEVVILITIPFCYHLLKNYIDEKGKNLAKLEDIEKLTKITEDVKKDVDNIKKSEQHMIEDIRSAVIDFYDAHIQWYEFYKNNPFAFKIAPSIMSGDEFLSIRSELKKDARISMYKLDIFIDNKTENEVLMNYHEAIDEMGELYLRLVSKYDEGMPRLEVTAKIDKMMHDKIKEIDLLHHVVKVTLKKYLKTPHLFA